MDWVGLPEAFAEDDKSQRGLHDLRLIGDKKVWELVSCELIDKFCIFQIVT
jgi:hypothetical protein